MKNYREIPSRGKLFIFDDQVLTCKAGKYYGTESRILFLSGLRLHFRSIHFYSKVKQAESAIVNEAFILPESARVTALPLSGHPLLIVFKFFLYLPLLLRQLKREVKADDYIYLSWPHPLSFFVWLACRARKNSPKIVFVARRYGYTRYIRFKSGFIRSAYRSTIKWMDSFLFRNGQQELIMAVGKKMHEKFSSLGNTIMLTIPALSEAEISHVSRQERKASLRLLVVSDNKMGDVENFALAIESLVKVGVPVILKFIGRSRELYPIQEVIVRHGLSANVCFHPVASYNEDLYNYFKDADMMVLPDSIESLSSSIRQAVKYGLPIVAPASAEEGSFLKQSGTACFYRTDDSSSIADAIYHLYKNPEVLAELGEGRLTDVSIESQQRLFVTELINHDLQADNKHGQYSGKKGNSPSFSLDDLIAARRRKFEWLTRFF